MSDQRGLLPCDADDEYLLKHVNAVALMPVRGGRKLSASGRRLFNVMLHRAQEDGEQDEYTARMHEIIGDARYNSNDQAPIRKFLRELMSTTVEWQSPSNGEIETWEACVLLSGAGTRKNKTTGAVTVFWRYDSKVREQLLSPDRYARLSLEAITQLSSHASMALYEICARYVDNPAHKTARRHWRWWRPVLRGVAEDDAKAEYRFFKRDVINKAIAEINALTNIEVKGPIEYKERDNKTISDIQFEVRLKSQKHAGEQATPLKDVGPADLPLIGRAINAGVDQSEIEGLLRKHGSAPLTAAVGDLEKRLQMPTEKVAKVLKPAGWLKANVERRAREDASAEAPAAAVKPLTQEDIKKHRAAWMDEWLRRRKEELRRDFEEFEASRQQEFLEEFRQELATTSHPQFLKRFDSSGWQHRMLRDVFTKFLGVRIVGPEWDKPSSEDILAIAAEQASRRE